TTSDAAGRYLLEDLAAGEVVFTARCSAFDGPDNATTTVQLFPGRRTQWDPVLLPPRVQTIHGRLLRPDGRPANTLLVVRAPGGGETKYLVSTGPAGRFLLQHASSDPLVAVLGQDREVPLDSDGDNVIQLTRDELPTTMLRGRVITEDGAPVEAGVTLTGAENAPATARTTGDGSFGIGPLPSGRDCLHIRTRSAGDLTLPLRLPADNVLDLGDIVVRSPGGLELAVRDPRGLPASAFVMLCDPAGNVISSRSTNDTLQLEAVQPGHLVVQADGGDLLATAEIEVQSGVRTLSTLQLHAVTTAELHFRGGGERVTVFARSGDGAFAGLFDSQRQSPLRHVNAPPSYGVCTLQLPPGRFRLDCNSTDGRHGEVELLVRSLDDHPEVEVVLRKR
ncbi:MAG TPA: carboxypeptidase-like regulatory domain-containing protein, partial [Planctomycetota bacterium]|nr:carboxypeptidase-like regulatory domain-containing protein [Planctomycetota bacterium]